MILKHRNSLNVITKRIEIALPIDTIKKTTFVLGMRFFGSHSFLVRRFPKVCTFFFRPGQKNNRKNKQKTNGRANGEKVGASLFSASFFYDFAMQFFRC